MPYGPVFQSIFQIRSRMPLTAGSPQPMPLTTLTVEKAFAHHKGAINAPYGNACLAAAYLFIDHWDTAHRIAQDLPTREGSYWHAIIHRREPDYWNSKYWFRRVGEHPVYPLLVQKIQSLPLNAELEKIIQQITQDNRWDPFAFVDACEHAPQKGEQAVSACEMIQDLEFKVLFQYCYERAIGIEKG